MSVVLGWRCEHIPNFSQVFFSSPLLSREMWNQQFIVVKKTFPCTCFFCENISHTWMASPTKLALSTSRSIRFRPFRKWHSQNEKTKSEKWQSVAARLGLRHKLKVFCVGLKAVCCQNQSSQLLPVNTFCVLHFCVPHSPCLLLLFLNSL